MSKPTVEIVFPSGAIRITDMVDGEFKIKQYMGYSKREAIAEFKEEFYKKKGK